VELSFNAYLQHGQRQTGDCDYILPVGLAGERHDQHSEATEPKRWLSFRQPALRVALEKMGWKPKHPARGNTRGLTWVQVFGGDLGKRVWKVFGAKL